MDNYESIVSKDDALKREVVRGTFENVTCGEEAKPSFIFSISNFVKICIKLKQSK